MKLRILAIIAIIFITSCNDISKQEQIIGFWQLQSVKTNQNISNPNQYKTAMDQLIRTTSIQLNQDKSFGATIWGDTSFGYWLIKDDSLVIQDLSNKNEFSVFIQQLTDEQLIIVETLDTVVEVFTFVR